MWNIINHWSSLIGMIPKRCICKHSAQYPLCDGSHTDKPWCSPSTSAPTDRLIIASASLSNLAEWWAHKVDAHVLSDIRQPLQAAVEDIWVLSDGTQLSLLHTLLDQISHKRQRWVHTSSQPTFPKRWMDLRQQHLELPKNFDLDTLNPATLPIIQPIQLVKTNIFVSHAVADEPLLMPILKRIAYVYDIQFFICADIGNEEHWYTEIETHLKKCDLVWAFTSNSFVQSTFCAFEIGMTRALDKSLHIFSIDASKPPAYVQHQQIQSLQRIHMHYPWLSEMEVLEQMCLQSLGSTHAGTWAASG